MLFAILAALCVGGYFGIQWLSSKRGDTQAPTVTIEQAAGQADPTREGEIHFTVVFSEKVSGFSAKDVILGGTTVGTPRCTVAEVAPNDGTTFDVVVSRMASDGTVTASLLAGVAYDDAGNECTASTSVDNEVRYDTTGPAVRINQLASQPGGVATFTVVFSEPVNGFDSSDVTLSEAPGASVSAVVETDPGDGTSFKVEIAGMAQGGTVSLAAGAVTDAAGNASEAASSTDIRVTIDQANGQPDPTNAEPIHFTVVFEKPVGDFESGDLSLGGTAGATTAEVTASEGATSYDVAVSGMARDGTVILNLPARKATDASGNPNSTATSTDNEVVFDTTGPVAAIAVAAEQAKPASGAALNFSVVFSEPVEGFEQGDVTVGGTAAGATVGAVTETAPKDGTSYSVEVVGMTASGTVTVNLAAGIATDAVGNGSTAASSSPAAFKLPGPAAGALSPEKIAEFKQDAFLRIDSAPLDRYPENLKERAKDTIRKAKNLKLLASINFTFGQKQPSAAAKQRLRAALEDAIDPEADTVVIIGFSDNTPFANKTKEESDALNWELSQDRAENIKKFLQGEGLVGFERDKVPIVGLGSTDVLSSQNKGKNRTVEIWLVGG